MASIGYRPVYDSSWAVVVGIDKYSRVSKLQSACNDARAIKEVLTTNFDFPSENVTLLLDQDATYEGIRTAVHALVDRTGPDDRVLFFYAGHGCTLQSYQKEAGFIVPVDGNANDTSSLLPWNEIHDISMLMKAKHALFIMDACYGGLFGMRKAQDGSKRLLTNMMTRFSRQFIAAGKANETVADGGGPRAGHSLFTGHLLDALDGGVESTDGLLSANILMSHVYGKVAREIRGAQAPHYGYLDGDGDFFFRIPDDIKIKVDSTSVSGVYVEMGGSNDEAVEVEGGSFVDQAKANMSDPSGRIGLSDIVTRCVRQTKSKLSEDSYPVTGSPTAEELATRLRHYETDVSELLEVVSVLCRWAKQEQQREIVVVARAIAGQIENQGGATLWLALRQYPMALLLYAGGISAIENSNYSSLASLMLTKVRSDSRSASRSVLTAVTDSILDAARLEAFKLLPGHKNNFTPYSEYIYKMLQPKLDDAMLLGSVYDELFDKYEILQALVYADLDDSDWGHPGRFAWKRRSRFAENDPYQQFVDEVMAKGMGSPYLKVGFFDGDIARFKIVEERFRTGLLDQLKWY